LLASALLALSLSAAGCGPPPLAGGPLPFTTGEAESYDLELFGMVRAGTLQLSVERPMPGGKVVPLRARARTDASVENLLRLAAVAFSWVDARTLLPERYREEAEENGVHKVSDARLSPPGPTIDLAFDMGGKPSAGHFPREGTVLDAVSAVYLLRAARLSAGDRFCFDLVARGRVWRVAGSVAAKVETLDTVVGRLETIRLDARATQADRPGDPVRQMHAWFSTDARRLFVAAVGDVDLGPVRLTLTEARPGRR
jgi:hypothetical protein